MAGMADAASAQVAPSSVDTKTRPSEVPNAATPRSGAPSRHRLSTFVSNHSGRPSRHRSKSAPPPAGPRYTARCGPPEGLSTRTAGPFRRTGPRRGSTRHGGPRCGTSTTRRGPGSQPARGRRPRRRARPATAPDGRRRRCRSSAPRWRPRPSFARCRPRARSRRRRRGSSVSERTSGGPPQGVYQASRPSTASNEPTLSRPSSPTRNSRASDVPTRYPARVSAMQFARTPSSRTARRVHPSEPLRRQISAPSTTAQAPGYSAPSASTVRPANSGGAFCCRHRRRPRRRRARSLFLPRCAWAEPPLPRAGWPRRLRVFPTTISRSAFVPRITALSFEAAGCARLDPCASSTPPTGTWDGPSAGVRASRSSPTRSVRSSGSPPRKGSTRSSWRATSTTTARRHRRPTRWCSRRWFGYTRPPSRWWPSRATTIRPSGSKPWRSSSNRSASPWCPAWSHPSVARWSRSLRATGPTLPSWPAFRSCRSAGSATPLPCSTPPRPGS